MIIPLDKKPALHHSVFVAPTATIIGDVCIGEHSSVWYNAVIRADEDSIAIGDNSNIQDNCTLHVDPGCALSIGDRVSVGHNCVLHGCEIGDDCIIGMGSIIMDGVRIGKNCLIGAGSLVTQRTIIPDGSVVMGSPAQVKREISSDELNYIQTNWKAYVELVKQHSNPKN